jgi:hypothetical protein
VTSGCLPSEEKYDRQTDMNGLIRCSSLTLEREEYLKRQRRRLFGICRLVWGDAIKIGLEKVGYVLKVMTEFNWLRIGYNGVHLFMGYLMALSVRLYSVA